ncbi:MAG: amino acid ABC transporter ATP-binding protein [Actinobacteria bacterium]|nr:amino acid ABC transporter ATP-binding protein [Actinomycetota bacterium]
MNQLLELKSLRKSFASNLVLDDVSINFPAQSATVIIGASGSGKSTLMRCMNLLEELNDGQILLAGSDISAYGIDLDSVRGQIGSVFQAFNLFPHLTVVENITLAPRLVHGQSKNDAEKSARELLARFGLSEKADEYPNLLSGGQQQRVAIIRAIATNPKLLLLDEVTSALDPVLIAEVLSLIAELKRDGMTMVIATHEMGFAKKIADNVVFLHQGKVHESGTPAEIFDSPKTQELKDFLGALHQAGRL